MILYSGNMVEIRKNDNKTYFFLKYGSLFGDFLNSDDIIYMRLTGLLCFLNYNDLRMRLIDKYKNSTDENIADIYTSFIQYYGWL